MDDATAALGGWVTLIIMAFVWAVVLFIVVRMATRTDAIVQRLDGLNKRIDAIGHLLDERLERPRKEV